MHFQLITLLAPILRPQAYLDPGSGSFLIQLVIAGLVGAGFLIRAYWKKIKGWFGRSDSPKDDDNDGQQGPPIGRLLSRPERLSIHAARGLISPGKPDIQGIL